MSVTPNSSSPPVTGEYEGFTYEIYDANSTTATVKIGIPDGQTVKAVPGCMLATSPNIKIAGKLKKTARAMLGPDTARSQTFTAEDGAGWVLLAPSFPGSLRAMPVDTGDAGAPICVGDDAFLASLGDVDGRAERQGAKKALFSGSGLYVKKVSGSGVMFVAGVGSMMTIDLDEGQTTIVDNGHLVTWPGGIEYDVQKAAKGWFGSGVSGEGVVTKITGPGQITVQTRNPEEVAGWIYDSKRPPGGGAA